MMSGVEAEEVQSGDTQKRDDTVQIDITAENQGFEIRLTQRCSRQLTCEFCSLLAGIEPDEVDDDTVASGLGELVNVIAGRIKSRSEERCDELAMGLPKFNPGVTEQAAEALFSNSLFSVGRKPSHSPCRSPPSFARSSPAVPSRAIRHPAVGYKLRRAPNGLDRNIL